MQNNELTKIPRKNKYDLLIILSLIIASAVILIYVNVYRIKKAENIVVEDNTNFDLTALKNNNRYDFKYAANLSYCSRYYIFYNISVNDCNICLKEVENYYQLISEHFGKYHIEQVAIINDTNKVVTKLFIRRYKLKMPVIYGYDQRYVDLLNNFKNVSKKRQLIVYDDTKKSIVGRIALLTGDVKSISIKIEMLTKIFNPIIRETK